MLQAVEKPRFFVIKIAHKTNYNSYKILSVLTHEFAWEIFFKESKVTLYVWKKRSHREVELTRHSWQQLRETLRPIFSVNCV